MSPIVHSPRALLFKALWPTLLAVFYFWGAGYHDEWLRRWGFNPELFPISIQQTYIAAYNMGISLWVHFLTVANQHLPPSIFELVLIAFALCAVVVILAWLLSRPILGRLGKKLTRRTVPRPISECSPFARKLLGWFEKIGITGAGLYGIFLVFPVVVIVTAVPPLYAGRVSFESDWSTKDYEKWGSAMWIDEEGHPRTGHLLTCSDRWCAVFDGTFAVSVPTSQMKLSKRQPPAIPHVAKGSG